MEGLNVKPKSVERILSQRALQMGSSFSCQICVVGFLCGVCLTSLFLASLTSLGIFELGGFSFTSISLGNSPRNSTSDVPNMVTSKDCIHKMKKTERWPDSPGSENDDRVSLLHSAWSALLTESTTGEKEFMQRFGFNRSNVPNAPHFENCKLSAQLNKRLDTQAENKSLPPWTSSKGLLSMYPGHQAISQGAYPPWVEYIQKPKGKKRSFQVMFPVDVTVSPNIVHMPPLEVLGSDEENYPLTRKVQHDIWMHQHPSNCSDPNVRFLVADWEKLPGFGIGAQIAGMTGLLAMAIKEKRVLVAAYYNRADHDGCKGSSRSSWSCYFLRETSQECRDRAFSMMQSKEAFEKGIVTTKESYRSKEIWAGRIPRVWGEPWSYLQPTTDVNGSLLADHRKMDRRWWRAQAVRYLMRFPSEYMCGLMNSARHAAFGKEAAKIVLASLPKEWPKEPMNRAGSDIEEFVWSSKKPWIPRPMLSMHVRMGDKACEMEVVGFEEYMQLADRIRNQFPHLNAVWLSTEMQEVIDKSKLYPQWNFYYTNVPRQVGNITMAKYEASLGRETGTNNPMVNFLMASEADFFIGALGSTWCFLIDGMRNTGGKVMAGYLSVNKDRFW